MEENIQPAEIPEVPEITEPKKKNWLMIGLVALAVVGLGIGVYFAFRNFQLKKQIKLNSWAFSVTGSLGVVNEISQYINDRDDFEHKFQPVSKKLAQRWISEDGWEVYSGSSPGVIMKVFVDDSNLLPASHSYSRRLHKVISGGMLRSEFMNNLLNSSESETDRKHYDYVSAFERGETRCSLTTNNDVSGGEEKFFIIGFVCSDNFQENYKKQLPYLKALASHFNEERSSNVVSSEEVIGGFFILRVRGQRSGFAALGKFENGTPFIIDTGQGPSSCDLMRQHNVPEEVYGSCYEKEDLAN